MMAAPIGRQQCQRAEYATKTDRRFLPFLPAPIFPARRNNASWWLLRTRTPVMGRVAPFSAAYRIFPLYSSLS